MGERLGAIFREKAAQGVEVRLLYDPIGSIGMLSRSYVRAMRATGDEMWPTSKPWELHTISYRTTARS